MSISEQYVLVLLLLQVPVVGPKRFDMTPCDWRFDLICCFWRFDLDLSDLAHESRILPATAESSDMPRS